MTRRIRSAEAAAIIGIKDHTLRVWRLRGKGPPFFKVGYAVRYDRAEVEAWMMKRKVER